MTSESLDLYRAEVDRLRRLLAAAVDGERKRIQRLARDDADRIDGHRSGKPTDILCANTLRHFADLLDQS